MLLILVTAPRTPQYLPTRFLKGNPDHYRLLPTYVTFQTMRTFFGVCLGLQDHCYISPLRKWSKLDIRY